MFEEWIVNKYSDVVRTYVEENYKKCFRDPEGDLKFPFIVPGSSYKFELWDWDSWLTGIALFAVSKDASIVEHEKGCVLNYLINQDKFGRIPVCINKKDTRLFELEENVRSNIHKPCLCLHALSVCDECGDVSWLRDYYGNIEKFLSYYEDNFKHECGLYFWQNDFAIGVDNEPCTFYRPNCSTGSIFLNNLMYAELKAMADISARLGMIDKEAFYCQKAEELKNAINNECWDERDGFFYSADLNLRPIDPDEWLHSGGPRTWNSLPMRIGVWTGFLSMWNGIATKEQAERMVTEHFRNKKTFYSAYGVRSLSKAEKMYSVRPQGNPSCWLGPIWGNANYMVFEALLKYGYIQDAKELAEKTVVMFGEDIESCGEMHEYYNPDTGEGVFNKGFQSWNLLVYKMADWLKQN